MSRFRSALLPSFVLAALVLAFPAASKASTAPPQLLPYTSTVVVGGGPFNSTSNGTTYTSTSHVYAVGDSCGPNSTLTAQDKYGNGCMGSQLTIVTPRAVAADSQGNVFIVDSYNYEVRRVDAHTRHRYRLRRWRLPRFLQHPRPRARRFTPSARPARRGSTPHRAKPPRAMAAWRPR